MLSREAHRNYRRKAGLFFKDLLHAIAYLQCTDTICILTILQEQAGLCLEVEIPFEAEAPTSS